MAKLSIAINAKGLLDYAKEGKQSVSRIKKAIRTVLNVGRTKARQEIAAQFTVRTGFLRRQSRKMQTNVSIRASEIKGRVSPLPRLLNIFEGGATLANGRGFLQPRPVVGPAAQAMQHLAAKEVNAVLAEVGK